MEYLQIKKSLMTQTLVVFSLSPEKWVFDITLFDETGTVYILAWKEDLTAFWNIALEQPVPSKKKIFLSQLVNFY